jgi:hypothetical protein
MTWVTTAIVGSTAVGLYSANKAASTQANAANQAAQLSQTQFDQTRADQAPWRAAGETALNALTPLATNYTPFGMNQFQQDPGYQFRLSEGQRALGHQAGSRGGLVSGTSLKAMQDYAQNSASQEYGNAFNRYQTERQARLGPLQSLAGLGQSSANFTGQLGAQNAANVGNYLTGGAAAQAAGQVGSANALTSGLGTYLNYSQGNSLLSALRGGSGGMTSADVTSGMNPYFAGGAGTGSL